MTEIAALQEALAGLTTGDPHEHLPGTGASGPRGVEAIFEYNGIVMNDRRLVDTFLVTQIDGFDDADVRDTRDLNPGQHGETPGNSFYGGRTIVLSGKITTRTISKMRDMQQGLRQAFADISKELPLIIRTQDPNKDLMINCKKQMTIRMPEAQDTPNEFRRSFQITLRASNPRFLSVVQENAAISFSSLYDFSESDTQTTENFASSSIFTRYPPQGDGFEIAGGVLQARVGQLVYRNLCLNPSFQNGTTDYVGNNAVLTQVSIGGVDGAEYGKLVVATGGDASVSKQFSTTPGNIYSLAAFAQSPGDFRWASVEIDWFDSSSRFISFTGGDLMLTSGTWARLPAIQNVVAPAGAETGVVYVVFHNANPGEQHHVDHIMLVDQAALPPVDYFDGNSWNAEWASTRGNSISVMRPYLRMTALRGYEGVQQTVKFRTPTYAPFVLDDYSTDTIARYTISPSSGHGVVIRGGTITVSNTTTKTLRHDSSAAIDGLVGYKIIADTGDFTSKAIFRMLDFSNYIYGEVSRVGSTVTLRIGKADGGVFSLLLPASTIGAIGTGATRWIRFRVKDDDLFAEFWTTNPALGGTPANTLSFTLTGADAIKFGAGVRGFAGMQLTPGTTAFVYDDLEVMNALMDDIQMVLSNPSERDYVYAGFGGGGRLSVYQNVDGVLTRYVGTTNPLTLISNTDYWVRGRMAKGFYFVELYKDSDPNVYRSSTLVSSSSVAMSDNDIDRYQEVVSPIAVMFRNRGFGVRVSEWRFESVDHPTGYDYYEGAGTLIVDGGRVIPLNSSRKILVVNNLDYDAGDVELTIKHGFDLPIGTSAHEVGVVIKYTSPGNFLIARVRVTSTTKQLLLYEVNDDVFTALTSATISTAVADRTDYWMRAEIAGDVVTLEHWLTDPALGGTPNTSIRPFTLTGASATNFGDGVTGRIGLEMLSPMVIDPWIDELRVFFTAFDAIGFVANNKGNFRAQPIIELDGPLTGLQMTNEANEESILLRDPVPDGEKWVLDIAGRRMYRDSDGANLFQHLDDASQWMELEPRENQIRIVAGGLSEDSQVSMRYRNTVM